MASQRPDKCPEKTRKGGPCGSPPRKTADPDGVFRCSSHSTSPEALELKRKQAEAGREAAKKRNRAQADVIPFPAALDFSSPEAIARSCGAVAARVLEGFSGNPAACGQSIAKLASEARAALRDAREAGGDKDREGGEIREFRFQVARRADGSDG